MGVEYRVILRVDVFSVHYGGQLSKEKKPIEVLFFLKYFETAERTEGERRRSSRGIKTNLD